MDRNSPYDDCGRIHLETFYMNSQEITRVRYVNTNRRFYPESYLADALFFFRSSEATKASLISIEDNCVEESETKTNDDIL